MITVLVPGITTGRNDRLCGASGVMQMPSTPGEIIGPPAATLYAVEPLGVETITPSPNNRTPLSLSVPRVSSIMRKGEPAETTASFSAVAVHRRLAATSLGLVTLQSLPASRIDASSMSRVLI